MSSPAERPNSSSPTGQGFATILGTESTPGEAGGRAASTAKPSPSIERNARWCGGFWPISQRNGQSFLRLALRCTECGQIGLLALWLTFCAVSCVGAESRALLWVDGGGTTALLNPASNVISAAIGEQGILVLLANGGVSLAESK